MFTKAHPVLRLCNPKASWEPGMHPDYACYCGVGGGGTDVGGNNPLFPKKSAMLLGAKYQNP